MLSHLLVNGIFRMAVPIFFIINGYFLYQSVGGGSAINTGKFKGWLKRLIWLYVIWTLIYSPIVMAQYAAGHVSTFSLLQTILFGYFHLWYVNAAIVGALVLFFLVQFARDNLIKLLILSCFISGIVIDYAGSLNLFGNGLIDKISDSEPSHRNFLFTGFAFLGLGWYLAKYKIDDYVTMKSSFMFFLVSLFLLLIEAYYGFVVLPEADKDLDNLASLPLVAPAVFLFASKFKFETIYGKTIATYAAAVYFIHIIFFIIVKLFFDFSFTTDTVVVLALTLIASALVTSVPKFAKTLL